MSFVADASASRFSPNMKMFLMLGTECAVTSNQEEIRRGELCVMGGPANETCPNDMDKARG